MEPELDVRGQIHHQVWVGVNLRALIYLIQFDLKRFLWPNL